MKYLIIGAGPAGLAFANRLKQLGESSFLVLEKEAEPGGLCRSTNVMGGPLDIGGGHILDVKYPDVLSFLFNFMPRNEWNKFDRISKIHIGKYKYIDYPYEANIWQMDKERQIDHLLSIAKAGSNIGLPEPDGFLDWINWKFGEEIAECYMRPYNNKIWSMDLNLLGTYWLNKLPNVSFRDTLASCLEHRAYGILPGHTQFYYPKKYGYGELWMRMGESVSENIEYNTSAYKIDFENRKINDFYSADIIINTIPWIEYKELIGVDDLFKKMLDKLIYTSIVVKFYDHNIKTNAHWTYFPDPNLEYHRILHRSNFAIGTQGYWTETNLLRSDMTVDNWYHTNEYAYPVNTKDKTEAIRYILEYGKKHRIYGLGRWGEWQHYNSDVTVGIAINLAEKLFSV